MSPSDFDTSGWRGVAFIDVRWGWLVLLADAIERRAFEDRAYSSPIPDTHRLLWLYPFVDAPGECVIQRFDCCC